MHTVTTSGSARPQAFHCRRSDVVDGAALLKCALAWDQLGLALCKASLLIITLA